MRKVPDIISGRMQELRFFEAGETVCEQEIVINGKVMSVDEFRKRKKVKGKKNAKFKYGRQGKSDT